MTEETISKSATVSPAETIIETHESKCKRWFELLLILLFAFSNPLLGSIFVLLSKNNTAAASADIHSVTGLVHETLCLALVGYVLSRRKLGFQYLGLRWSVRLLFVGLGLGIVGYSTYILSAIIAYTSQNLFHVRPEISHTYQQIFQHPTWLSIPFFLLNPFFEELIVRAYAMTEIENLTGSWVVAAIASTFIQESYHLYCGWYGAFTLSLQFLVYSIYFARTRQITPIIVAHGIFDVWALIRMLR